MTTASDMLALLVVILPLVAAMWASFRAAMRQRDSRKDSGES